MADERATAERRAANLTAADEAALGGDVLGSRAYAEELADREAEEAARMGNAPQATQDGGPQEPDAADGAPDGGQSGGQSGNDAPAQDDSKE